MRNAVNATVVGLGGVAGILLAAAMLFATAARAEPSAGNIETLGELNAYEFDMFDKVLHGNIRDATAVLHQEAAELQQLNTVDTQGFGLANQALLDGNVSAADSDIAQALTADTSIMGQDTSAVETIASDCLSNSFTALTQELNAITSIAPDMLGAL
jgi:hypothetical protein